MKRTSAVLRGRLELRTVLGLREPDVSNWEKVREARLRDVQRMLPFARAISLFSAAALITVLWGPLPHWQLAGWGGTLLLAILTAVRRRHLVEAQADAMLAGRLSRACLWATLCGVLWAVPPLLFVAGKGPDVEIAVCLVLGGVIAAAPLTLSAVPMAMLGFMLPIALGLTILMARTGSALLTFLPLVFALCLFVGGLATGGVALRRRVAEAALGEETEIVSLLLHEFAEKGAHWLWEIDVRKRLAHVSLRFADALGRPAAELENRPLVSLIADGWCDSTPPPELRALLDLLDARISFKDQVVPVMVAGEVRWWRLSATPRYAGDGRFAGFRGVGADVTEQRRRIEQVDRLARADGLTGIDNRMGFTERLRGAVARSVAERTPHALLLIDLDRFKAVNDTYGHPMGDRLLQAAAARLTALAGDGACGRLGGDEFAVLTAAATDAAMTLAMRVRDALERPFELDGTVLHIGASIGIAVAPEDGDTLDALMHNADLALYRTKREGGAPCRYAPAMRDPDARRLTLEADLPHALEREELTLTYLPVTATDGRLVGFEARPCWRHPRYGPIPGGEFLSIAGAVPGTVAIGDWLLHTACAEASRWPDTLHLTLVLSRLRDVRLPLAVRVALAMSGLSPDRLELALPETLLTEAGPALDPAIDALRATGARLALEGFEDGFVHLRGGRFAAARTSSSLLDRAACGDDESVALVRALAAMAHTLDMRVIATGVDSPSARAAAFRLGCDLAQVSGPLPPEAAFARARAAAMPARRVA